MGPGPPLGPPWAPPYSPFGMAAVMTSAVMTSAGLSLRIFKTYGRVRVPLHLQRRSRTTTKVKVKVMVKVIPFLGPPQIETIFTVTVGTETVKVTTSLLFSFCGAEPYRGNSNGKAPTIFQATLNDASLPLPGPPSQIRPPEGRFLPGSGPGGGPEGAGLAEWPRVAPDAPG